MRVLLIDSVCKYGSTGEICYNLYNYVNTTGNTAGIFYGRGESINEPNIYKFGIDYETVLHAGLARITGLNGCFSPISTKRLIRKIEDFKPDVIHLHELHAYFVDLVPLIEYIKRKGIPVVWTFHCEYMYTGKCGHAGSCDNWKRECGNCPAVKDYPKSLLFDRTKTMLRTKKRLLYDLNATYITPSEHFACRVRESYLRGKPVEVIHNGIDTNIFYPREKGKARGELGISPDKKMLLSVAPRIMREEKGGNWIIELAKRQKDKSVEYVLVGEGERVEKPLQNVTIIPLIKDKNKLAQIYSAADCYLLCSKHETFSLTCAEALCCGIPIAGFKCDAPETIFMSPWAEFVDYGNLDKLEEQIIVQLRRKKTEISEYGIKFFSMKSMCSTYMKMYKRMVEGI